MAHLSLRMVVDPRGPFATWRARRGAIACAEAERSKLWSTAPSDVVAGSARQRRPRAGGPRVHRLLVRFRTELVADAAHRSGGVRELALQRPIRLCGQSDAHRL